MKSFSKKAKGGGKLEDCEIIRLYFERNEEAIRKTEEKYGAYAFKTAENILGDSGKAEECLNSALLGVWNSVPPNEPNNLKVYLAKISRNLAIGMLEKENAKKRGGNCVFEAEELSEFLPSKESVEESYDAKELGESINSFVSELPEKERKIFIRRYFFFENPKIIGEKFGFSENRVSVILHRTRKKLKKHLEKEGFF